LQHELRGVGFGAPNVTQLGLEGGQWDGFHHGRFGKNLDEWHLRCRCVISWQLDMWAAQLAGMATEKDGTKTGDKRDLVKNK
jgi:hypothetical protein